MNAFFHALAFLTRIPAPVKQNQSDWEKSPMWYPLVGLVLGLLLFLFDFAIAQWFPALVRAVLDVAVWIYLTGGLHLDGWMDTADGLGSYRERERALQIMKDSRVGAMGAIAGVLAILFKVTALASFPMQDGLSLLGPLVAAAVLGRTAVVWVMFSFPYIQTNGLGTGMKNQLTRPRLGLSFLLALSPLSFFYRGWAVGLLGIVLLFTWLYGRKVTRRLGGCTGDIYGAVVIGAEIITLLGLLWLEVNGNTINLAPTW